MIFGPPKGVSPENPAPDAKVRARASRRRRAGKLWRDRILALIVSLVSLAAFCGLIWLVVTSSEQWPRIQKQFFNWEAVQASFPAVLRGFWINMQVWVVCLIVTGMIGLGLAAMRALQGPWATPLRIFSVLYVDLFRGVPALLTVLLFGFGIPALRIPGLPTSALFWGGTALTLCYAAYVCEVFRSGLDSVHEGQRAAAKALGLNQGQALRYAILPQALRNVTPALLNLTVALQKDVALLSVLGVRDAVREAQIYTAQTFNYSSLIGAAFLFLLATVPLARFTDYVTQRDRRRRLQGAG